MNQTEKIINGIGKREYSRLHMKLYSQFGKAARCENPNCNYKNPKRYEWALKRDRQYSSNKEDYLQLCVSCHRKYDYDDEAKKSFLAARIGERSNKTKFKNADVIKIIEMLNSGIAAKEVARIYNVSYCAIIDIKTGRNWSSITNIKYSKYRNYERRN